MTTFFTALTWGLGVSLGGTVGLLVFIIAKGGLDWVFGRAEAVERVIDFHHKSLRALEQRNSLTVDTIAALEQIAETVEKCNRRDSS